MCLNPIKIRTPAKRFTPHGGQLLRMSVRCNHCAECVESMRQEWTFRTFYQIKDCYNKGGYIYYVTLTYSDEHLPKLSHFCDIEKYGVRDFSVFSHRDFKLFLKNLRIRIKRKYGYSSNVIKYFLTSEYGTREDCTHRPHYHLMLFVYVPIDPLQLAKLVDECWIYGRTDGPKYKPNIYVLNHIYTSNTDFADISSASMYVSKYITKSSKFQKVLDKRISMLKCKGIPPEELKELIRSISMFHRQSQGYGLSYLYESDSTIKSFIDEDIGYIKSTDEVVHTQPLPMYYKRHLYYVNKARPDKTRYWELTAKGVEHMSVTRIKNIDNLVAKYKTILYNTTDDYYDIFNHLLSNRTLEDLAIYSTYYCNRSLPVDYVHDKYITRHDSIFDIDNRIKQSSFVNSSSDSVIIDEDKLLRLPYRSCKSFSIKINVHLERYINEYSFNQHSSYRFRNFDILLDLLDKMDKYSKKTSQQQFDYLEELKEKIHLLTH